jgi:transcriptional regulator with XRE-family HTH domain
MSSEIDALIGWRLRIRRRILGLTQREVGLSVGVSPQMVHKWETAQSTLYAATLFELAKALGVGPGFFFMDAEPSPDRTPANLTPPLPPGS